MNLSYPKKNIVTIVSMSLLLLLIVSPIVIASNDEKAEDPIVEKLTQEEIDELILFDLETDDSEVSPIVIASNDEKAEDPIVEKLTQEEIDELILFDLETDNSEVSPMAVSNINQHIDGNTLMKFTSTSPVLKINGSNIRWNINWTHQGRADIGVIGDNGHFYYLYDSGGSSIRNMNITLTQDYTFAIRNTISTGANFAGWRDL